MIRPADGFFRLLEGLRLRQLHENYRAGHTPGQLDAKIPAVGRIACQGRQRLELPLKGKPSLDRCSHEGAIRQGQWLFWDTRIHGSHRLRIILMLRNLVTQRRRWAAWSSSCSRNARPQKALVGRAQSRINQAALEERIESGRG